MPFSKENQIEQGKHPKEQHLLQNRVTSYTEAERAEQQASWSNFGSPLDPKKNYHDFPAYFYAGFWTRALAFMVDVLCICAIRNIFLDTILGGQNYQLKEAVLSPYNLISLAIYLGYFILLTKLNNGQTIGKMIFGIQVICFNEAGLSWQTVLIREGACRFILQVSLLFLGYLPAAFSKSKQHVGDLLADTSVVTLNTIKAFNGLKY